MNWNTSYKPRVGIIEAPVMVEGRYTGDPLAFAAGTPEEPLTDQEIKDHLKIDFDDLDDYILFMGKACRQELEKYLGVSMVVKQITLTVDVEGEFVLPYGPLISVTSTNRRTGTSTLGIPEYDVIAPADYTINNGRMYSALGRYKIVYTAGFLPGQVPADMKLQLLRLIAYRMSNAGDEDQMMTIDRIVGNFNKNFSWL